MHRTHDQHPHFAHPVPMKKNYGAMDAAKAMLAAGGIGLTIGLIAVPTLVVGPWMVKAFKPEWSYGRRLAASFAFSTVVGALIRIVRATTAEAPAAGGSKAAAATFVPSAASAAPR
jgi:hypothetical protein